MLYSILKMIVDVVTTILGGAFLLRFWIQIVRARPPFQIANFLIQLTDWFIRPLRKTIPGWAGYDWFDTWLINYFSARIILFLVALSLLNWIIYGFMGLLIIEAIFSWVNPYSPIASFVRDLNRPLLEPVRRFLPTLGGFDFSTLIVFFLLQIVSRTITHLILSNLI